MTNQTKDQHWEQQSLEKRMLYVMEHLIDDYGYPVNGAAGVVGNLVAESGVIPNRIEGSAPGTPMRSQNFAGAVVNHTPQAIMNRNSAQHVGPARPGIGLAQWTAPPRRAGLFSHPFDGGGGLGANAVFSMDDQIDYLADEIHDVYAGVNAFLKKSTVQVNDACDEVVYNYEVPGAIIQGGSRLPRSDPRVRDVFAKRRPSAQAALNAYRAAHP
ncbi:phage tail tip lysozyme [Streptomyces hainanensis]|uniref:Phage tail lysozyme domain-containing protein n=1 Tax=Streptomyces hainanensis TaxID=402648 RepID=A0A4R4T851_9ACTN|nr:phage tail tip lysozyme [Streptomyces hainanensis]TDC73250.1 hypothetical protein E1283_19665 [Streptomyces hainanensis]